MAKVSGMQIPVEVSIYRITERLDDLDFCALDIWDLEFLHGGAQTHLDALKLQVNSDNSLVPGTGCIWTFRNTQSNPLTPETESGMRKAQVSLFCSDVPCTKPPKSSTQVLWISSPRRL